LFSILVVNFRINLTDLQTDNDTNNGSTATTLLDTNIMVLH
jgi:hypothetical protein